MTPPADVPKRSSTEAAHASEQSNIENAGNPASEDAASRSTKGRATTKSRNTGKSKDTQEAATTPNVELLTDEEQPVKAEPVKLEQPVTVEPVTVELPIAQKQSISTFTESLTKEEPPIKEESAKKELPAIQVEQPKSTSAAPSVQSSTASESASESKTEVVSSAVVPTGLPVLAKLANVAKSTSKPHHQPIVAAGVLARASSPGLPKNRPIRPHESDEERSITGSNLMGFVD